ncbi:MAG: biotin/lipoyl-binding protein [Verrucomicrobia bacterium]|nr:MAG: biotin/lipoyl-binding protein [Verrucomicrobiota bacterium]
MFFRSGTPHSNDSCNIQCYYTLDLAFVFCSAMSEDSQSTQPALLSTTHSWSNFLSHPNIIHFIFRAIILLTVLIGIIKVWDNIQTFPRTDDAEIVANTVGVAAQVGGTIVELHVVDNQKVKRGDLIMTLDSRPYEAEAARAKAKLELVCSEVKGLEQQIHAAKATLRDREAQASYAVMHYERLKPLLEGNFASADQVQQAQSYAESTTALVRESEALVEQAVYNLAEVNGKNTHIEEAEAELWNAELHVSYCKIYASCDGYITNLKIAPGSYAGKGEQLFTIVDSSIWYVLANFREIDIHHVKEGQSARVYLMAKRHTPISGIVQGISRGVFPYVGASRNTAGEGGVLAVVPPTFDFIQLATRFPIRIVLQEQEKGDFRLGGKASVIIDTRTTPFGNQLKLLQEPDFVPFVPPLFNKEKEL